MVGAMTENSEVLQVTGKVKWYNQFKGYGFLSVEGIHEDVFLHFSVLNKSGIKNLCNDDIILCNIVKTGKGYQVAAIMELTHSNKYEIAGRAPETVTVTMKWFNPAKGFGFAQLESGEDVFIHSNLLKKHKMTAIEPGTKLSILMHYTNFGYEAIDLLVDEK